MSFSFYMTDFFDIKLTALSTDVNSAVDSGNREMAEAVGSKRDPSPSIDASLSSSLSTPQRSYTRLYTDPGDLSSPDGEKDAFPLPTSSPAPVVRSHSLESSSTRSTNACFSLPDPVIHTTESLVPAGALRLGVSSQFTPSISTDGEPIAPTSTSSSGDIDEDADADTSTPRSLHIQEDGGVRLAGGPPGEALAVEEYLTGWDDFPPPYQRF